ncbi:NAD-dependent epimerase/dehydratase family protein [Mitsuaria sp. GD03876]|uniref:NAD-dependent epimerase/dehydratase family protein n=1 Tax=Mitsuaria sp. GD03876 TaxID=2975399 RepID=UPI00244CBFAC|nr:NAD-dependent epimerase/dehydratase family protein [Mitsuaria sp. GD03876]MDH0867708.1 NAD-dependent epimerase/dehydratase family protein [Mitsuaria sp. GD03876]
MNVLLCGASGFIGRAIAHALREAGHQVVEGRSATMDFATSLDPATWAPRLEGIDAVINAVGVLRDTPERPIDALHHRAPAALFQACADRGVRRVIQISALGIEGNGTRYATTKRAADAALLALHRAGRLDVTIVRPSIVFGRAGASSRMFMALARLPVLMLPAEAARARVQPLTVHDLGQACAALVALKGPELMEAVGPRALTLGDFIVELRRQLGRLPAWRLTLPAALSPWSARLGDLLPFLPWGSETLSLLRTDNTGDASRLQSLLTRPATPIERFVEAAWASGE